MVVKGKASDDRRRQWAVAASQRRLGQRDGFSRFDSPTNLRDDDDDQSLFSAERAFVLPHSLIHPVLCSSSTSISSISLWSGRWLI